MYTVYALFSRSCNKIYIGYTSDMEQRLFSHNHPKNSGWTAKYQPWVVVHSETFHSKAGAMAREKQLKSSRGRVFVWKKVNELFEGS